MRQAVFIALAVGGSTVLGGAIGYLFPFRGKRLPGRVFAFAGGVMLAASVADLILPALEGQAGFPLAGRLISVMLGGVLITMMGAFVPFLERRLTKGAENPRLRGALLFVLAVAMHNLPEGLACGAALGQGMAAALPLTVGVAAQNVPEGMIVIPPLTGAGVGRKKALLVSALTGAIEVFGVFCGRFAAGLSEAVLPYLLCVTGGAMSFIICTDVLATEGDGAGRGFSFLFGMCLLFALISVF
ncbi:MAG: ZIP family metal transporter [Clostridia bacterium]|nr:ZIP family metal transporter [Clostridia bacterium]